MESSPQPGTRRAVIDIGTNSVKLLIADMVQGGLSPVLETSRQTRLGRGFYKTHELQPQAIEQTIHCVDAFVREARSLGATGIRLLATSAVRDARNANDFKSAIRSLNDCEVEIIDGRREAQLVYAGVRSNPVFQGHPLLILDLGGGSSEFILGDRQRVLFFESFLVGTVRLLELFPPNDTPGTELLEKVRQWLSEFLSREVLPHLQDPLRRIPGEELIFVGTGGTTTLLARMEHHMDSYDRERIESTVLGQQQLTAWVELLWEMNNDRRQAIIGLPPEKSDVILIGSLVYQMVMKLLGIESMRTSMRGLRYGALLEGNG